MARIDFFKICNFIISLGNNKEIELQVQKANIPGITLGSIDVNWMSMKDKRTGDSIEYDSLSLDIIIDEDLKSYKQIYDNLILAHNPETNVLEVQKHIFDGVLNLTTNKNNIQHSIFFKDCWIKSISDISLETTSSEDESIVTTLDIQFNWFIFQ